MVNIRFAMVLVLFANIACESTDQWTKRRLQENGAGYFQRLDESNARNDPTLAIGILGEKHTIIFIDGNRITLLLPNGDGFSREYREQVSKIQMELLEEIKYEFCLENFHSICGDTVGHF